MLTESREDCSSPLAKSCYYKITKNTQSQVTDLFKVTNGEQIESTQHHNGLTVVKERNLNTLFCVN